MRKFALERIFVSFLLLFLVTVAVAEDRVRPFTLASTAAGSIADKADGVRSALMQNGFQLAGEYAPYDGALILIVTNDSMRKNAAKSDMGGFGSAVRVSLTEVNGQVQVSYTNPVWMAGVYRMATDGVDVAASLKAALGAEKAFGSEGGRTVSNLKEYHYMMFMPYFNDAVMLAEYGSQQEALSAVNAALQARKGGASKVYQIDIDGKDESLIGVALKQGDGADATVMKVTDTSDLKHTGHLPYEMLVSGGKVMMLHGKFRIAQSFPDLTMGTFMKISSAPDAIENVLRAVAGK